MSTFVQDSFTDVAGTGLLEHVGETGASWSAIQGGGDAVINPQGRVAYAGNGLTGFVASGVPDSLNYDAYHDLYFAAAPDGQFEAVTNQEAADAKYVIQISSTGGGDLAFLSARYGGNTPTATVIAPEIEIGANFRLKFTRRQSGGSASIAWAYSLDGVNYTPIHAYTDTAPPSVPGKAGFRLSNNFIQVNRLQVVSAGAAIEPLGVTPPPPAGDVFYINDAALSNAFTPVWAKYSTGGRDGLPVAVAGAFGAEINFNFSGNELSLLVDTSRYGSLGAGVYPKIAVVVDGGVDQIFQLQQFQTDVVVTVAVGGNHTCKIIFIWMSETSGSGLSRWENIANAGPDSTLRIIGFRVAVGQTCSNPTGLIADYGIICGDSITSNAFDYHGIDSRFCYAHNIFDAFGLRTLRLGFAGTGWTVPGNDGVPKFNTNWQNHDNQHPRDWSGIAANVKRFVIACGQNDGGTSDAALRAEMATSLAAVHAQFVNAEIYVLVPFAGTKRAAITAEVNAEIAVGDTKLHLIDLGAAGEIGIGNGPSYETADGLHPSWFGHIRRRALVTKQMAEIDAAQASLAALKTHPEWKAILASVNGDKTYNPQTDTLTLKNRAGTETLATLVIGARTSSGRAGTRTSTLALPTPTAPNNEAAAAFLLALSADPEWKTILAGSNGAWVYDENTDTLILKNRAGTETLATLAVGSRTSGGVALSVNSS